MSLECVSLSLVLTYNDTNVLIVLLNSKQKTNIFSSGYTVSVVSSQGSDSILGEESRDCHALGWTYQKSAPMNIPFASMAQWLCHGSHWVLSSVAAPAPP